MRKIYWAVRTPGGERVFQSRADAMGAYIASEKIVPGEVRAHFVIEEVEGNATTTVRVFPTNEERAKEAI